MIVYCHNIHIFFIFGGYTMIVGIPKGLFYYRYYSFFSRYLKELNIKTITSHDTNKLTLNNGVHYSVDEACLPIKIFHGHVAELINKCDLIIVPRIMQIYDGEYVCPKFCGLPEMILNSIPNVPIITTLPLFFQDSRSVYTWCLELGHMCNKNDMQIYNAFQKSYFELIKEPTGIMNDGYDYHIGLLGHSYLVFDDYCNMDIVKKINNLDMGIITQETISPIVKDRLVKRLVKKPFWAHVREVFSPAVYMAENNLVNGIIILSSFQCGIDSVIIDLIKEYTDSFPMLVIKIDELSGEAGINTRLEAFTDMIKRRSDFDNNIPAHG